MGSKSSAHMIDATSAGFWDTMKYTSGNPSNKRICELSIGIQLALEVSDLVPNKPVRAYTKNNTKSKSHGMDPGLAAKLEEDATVLLQYDGRNKQGSVTKNFECKRIDHFLRAQASLHPVRTGHDTWPRPLDCDFSPYHAYYNIGTDPVRLFVDFDQPKDETLMQLLRDQPGRFWEAVSAFVAGLVSVIPGYQPDWVAVFRSGGNKLSAHLHDLRIWATDVSFFKQLVENVCALPGEHSTMLRAIVDVRVYHPHRAWRMPGHCKRMLKNSDVARFLSIQPDPQCSGAAAIALFAQTIDSDEPVVDESGALVHAARVAWAAFCYPHAMCNLTFEAGHCVDPIDGTTPKKQRLSVTCSRGLQPGHELSAPWSE